MNPVVHFELPYENRERAAQFYATAFNWKTHFLGPEMGDYVLVSGTIGDHGMAIMSVREGLEFESIIKSDSAPLNDLIASMLKASSNIHVLRDPTRGGAVSPTFDLRTLGQNGHHGYGGINIGGIQRDVAGWIAADTPDVILLMIGINGISDLTTMLQEVPVYWRGWPDWHLKYLGDPKKPEDMEELRQRSPLSHAVNMTKPLLIIQGSNDVRVIRDQADRMVKELQKNKAPVEYVVIDGAGHQSRNWPWQTRLQNARRMERFLATHLGGRADGFDYAVLGASIIPH